MGRPPDLAKREAILAAARELLAEVGYSSMTIDAVAQRAGSNRVLVYRVWDSKLNLACDALLESFGDFEVPDTGDVLDDLRGFVAQHVERMTQPAYVLGMPGVTVELLTEPATFRQTYRRFVKPSEDGFRTIVRRAVDRGELTGDVDAAVLTRLASGVVTGLAQTGRLTPQEITELALRTLIGGVLPVP